MTDTETVISCYTVTSAAWMNVLEWGRLYDSNHNRRRYRFSAASDSGYNEKI